MDNNSKELLELSRINYENGDFLESISYLEKILVLNDKEEEINFYIALNYIGLNNIKKAESYLKRELKINRKHEKSRILLEKIDIQSNFPLITIFLFILNCLVFLFIYPEISFSNLIKFSVYESGLSFSKLISSLFFHANIFHFLSNMFFLLVFGFVLEKHIGSQRFLLTYIISGIVGNFLQAIFLKGSFVIGASSAIFGILGFLVLKLPLLNLNLFGFLRVPAILVFGSFFALNEFILRNLNIFSVSSGDIAHLFGFLVGILFAGIFYDKLIDVFYNWVFIFFGFWLMVFSIEKFILGEVVFFVIYLLISLFLIIYSYLELKLMISFNEGGDFE